MGSRASTNRRFCILMKSRTLRVRKCVSTDDAHHLLMSHPLPTHDKQHFVEIGIFSSFARSSPGWNVMDLQKKVNVRHARMWVSKARWMMDIKEHTWQISTSTPRWYKRVHLKDLERFSDGLTLYKADISHCDCLYNSRRMTGKGGIPKQRLKKIENWKSWAGDGTKLIFLSKEWDAIFFFLRTG